MLPPRPIVLARQDFLARSVEHHPVTTLALVGGSIGALFGVSVGALFGAKLAGATIGAAIMGLRGAQRGKELRAWIK